MKLCDKIGAYLEENPAESGREYLAAVKKFSPFYRTEMVANGVFFHLEDGSIFMMHTTKARN